MTINSKSILTFFVWLCTITASGQVSKIDLDETSYKLYPDVNETQPDLPSPFTSLDDQEYVIAVTKENKYAIMRVTLGNEREIGPQLIVDIEDFPELARSGLHSEKRLDHIKAVTGRTLDEITRLGRPGGLSEAGFMAEDETILSVLKGDNRIVHRLNLTHPQLAKPLFHVLNMMETDFALNRWNMARHRWENIRYFFYNDRKVFVDVEDTKGGQLSIFDDGIVGGFFIQLWRDFDIEELKLLGDTYGHLTATQFDTLKTLLSTLNTGEIQPQYIMRYGFYEGHTYWRTDPIALSFIFGIKTLTELNRAYHGDLLAILTNHFTE